MESPTELSCGGNKDTGSAVSEIHDQVAEKINIIKFSGYA